MVILAEMIELSDRPVSSRYYEKENVRPDFIQLTEIVYGAGYYHSLCLSISSMLDTGLGILFLK